MDYAGRVATYAASAGRQLRQRNEIRSHTQGNACGRVNSRMEQVIFALPLDCSGGTKGGGWQAVILDIGDNETG
jgi:hypothetical protein